MNSSAVPAKVCRAGSAGYVDALPGIRRKAMVDGVHTQLVEFKLAKGAVIPPHSHSQEQTGYLVSGHLVFTIAGVVHEMHPGDGWTIPGGVEHGVQVPADSVVIEVFSPVREDYRT
jgi:quercetin dioxygenase-like cupin family protein